MTSTSSAITARIEATRKAYPAKFASEEQIFARVQRGDRIFISTGCAEPQYLVRALIEFVQAHPKAFFDAEVLQVWTLGVAPYTDEKFRDNFRHNSFFIGDHTREAVNAGVADYTPIFLSEVPRLIQREIVPIDVALIQTSLPDEHGYVSLGISVDIVKAAVEKAATVIAQMNPCMPRVHGDGFVHIDALDCIVPREEPILEYRGGTDSDVIQAIGKYVARLIQDGDTIQVGYGIIPDAILGNLKDKRDLGVHSELLSDGIADLMRSGVINNARKSINRGKTVAAFCMGQRRTYDYLDDNPMIELRAIDYVNNQRVIAKHDHMVAINAALEIDLTGQATAESIGSNFFSGIGGQADFMRGAVLSSNGRSILTLQSTAAGGSVSRIVPLLKEGAGATLTRGDIHYVVTEHGIAYLHGKNIRERAMELIAIAHPKFRAWLIEEAKAARIIYRDQLFIPGKRGEYPENLETYRTTRTGLNLFLRPVKISDETPMKDFIYSLSDESLYRRFFSKRRDMHHDRLQQLVVIDYTKEMAILALLPDEEKETVVAVGRYAIEETSHTAEVAFAVRDDYQNRGIATLLLTYLAYLAKRQGLLGFTAEVLVENQPMLHVFRKTGFDIQSRVSAGIYELRMGFGE